MNAPVRRALLSSLVLLVALPAAAGRLATPSEEHAAVWADKVVMGLALGDGSFLDRSMSVRAMIDIVVEGIELPTGLREGLEQGVGSSFGLGAKLAENAALGGRTDLLRFRTEAGELIAIMRTIGPDAGVGYMELYLGRDTNGAVRVVDFTALAVGERTSDTLRDNLAQVLASQGDRGLLQQMAGQNGEFLAAYPQINLLTQQVNAGRGADALATWAGLPKAVREKHRQVAVLRILAGQQVGGDEYEKAILDFGRLYPGDASQALWAVELHLARERWDRALKSVDALDAAVGGDAFLDDMRGGIFLVAGRRAEALTAYRRLTKAMPGYAEGWFGVLSVAVDTDDHESTAKTLSHLESEFGYDVEAMVADEYYARFVASERHARWRADRSGG